MLTEELLACRSKRYLHGTPKSASTIQLSEPDVLCNFSTNNASTDLNHKTETETESEIAQDCRGLKQSVQILENGDNVLYRLEDKVYLLERTEF